MPAPALPVDEAERLEALHECHLINTPIEQGFERITRLTKRIFDVPIVAISLVDKDEQWFKSISGLEAWSTPREVSFCGHTILRDEVLVVEDARCDDRFSDNPFVKESPSIRFYAGCPVHSANDYRIGTLCIIDNRPRQLSSLDKSILKDIASLVDTEIRNHHYTYNSEQKLYELSANKRKNLLDPVTKLWNRQGITEIIELQRKISHKTKSDFGVIQLSIDCYKTFLEENGEEAANDLLRSVTQCLINACRSEDSIGYLGGKEFLVVLPLKDNPDLLAVTTRIRKNLQEEQLTKAGKVKITVTESAVVYDQKKHPNILSLLMDAENGLREGRQLGGNRIIIH
jgi:diguanylate cyclase (GGDEF)-like protein